jgi:hypothetical protein
MSGLEVEDQLDEPQRKERQADLELWKQEGQTWWGAFLPATRSKVRAFLEGNKTANDVVAEEVAKNTVPGTPGPIQARRRVAGERKRAHGDAGGAPTGRERALVDLAVGKLRGMSTSVRR